MPIVWPRPLRKGDVVAVTAPSDGVDKELHPRLDVCLGHLRGEGFDVVEGKYLRRSARGVSGPTRERALEFRTFWNEARARAILPPWGGELLIQALPHLALDTLDTRDPPWVMGYSDTSTLLFAISVVTGVATAHGPALMELCPAQQDDVTLGWRKVLSTERSGSVVQRPSFKWHRRGPNWGEDPSAAFSLDQPTVWRATRRGQPVPRASIEGRLIGGCLDTIGHLVGTPYGDVRSFAARFPGEKLLIYLENAEMAPPQFCRALWQLRLAGWFDVASGLMIGRHGIDASDDLSFQDALLDVVADLDLPVVFDVDVGHRPPQMTLVNGAHAILVFSGEAATLTQAFF